MCHRLSGRLFSNRLPFGANNGIVQCFGPGQGNVSQSSQERGQQGQSRALANFQGAQLLTQQNSFQGQQSLRNLNMMQGGNFQGNLQSLGGVPQQTNFAGQSHANHLAHFQVSPSQQSLMHMASSNQLSSYQAQVCILPMYSMMSCRNSQALVVLVIQKRSSGCIAYVRIF